MDKDKLIDLLAQTSGATADRLYYELVNPSVDVNTFVAEHKDELRKIEGYSSIEKIVKSPMEQVANAFDTYSDLPDIYIQDKAESLGLSEDQVRDALATIQQAKDYQEGRQRRAQEIKDAGIFSPWTFASDYSKQRYIDDPDNSLFGKEGNFNPYSTEGQNELGDLLFGATGAVADAIPGVGGVVVGPAVRAGRDISHKLGDDSDQKDWGTILENTGVDLAANAGTNYLPTAILTRGKKYMRNSSGDLGTLGRGIENVQTALSTDALVKNVTSSVNKFSPEVVKSAKSAQAWAKDLPDGPFKNDMLSQTKNGVYGKQLESRIELWKQVADDNFKFYANKNISKKAKELPGAAYEVAFQKANRPKIDDPWSKTAYFIGKNYDTVGGTLVKEAKDAASKEPVETLDAKHDRWQKGYVTFNEMLSDEYKEWKDSLLR